MQDLGTSYMEYKYQTSPNKGEVDLESPDQSILFSNIDISIDNCEGSGQPLKSSQPKFRLDL
jgi:hypothetical protein